jgi:hypothetical protein
MSDIDELSVKAFARHSPSYDKASDSLPTNVDTSHHGLGDDADQYQDTNMATKEIEQALPKSFTSKVNMFTFTLKVALVDLITNSFYRSPLRVVINWRRRVKVMLLLSPRKPLQQLK